MEIRAVAIVGLGALGVLFGHQMEKNLPEGTLRVVADAARIERYRRDGVYSNGEICRFRYAAPEDAGDPADLVLFAVKFDGLAGAIAAVRNHVGPGTIILSLLNGISSEGIIGRALGEEKVLPCVAQGMDAVKVENRLTYHSMGKLCFGDWEAGAAPEKAAAVARFFGRAGVPHEVCPDMARRLWGKFMLNVGVNQAVAVYGCDYGAVQRDGPARQVMIAAMEEVLALSEREGVPLTRGDLDYWLRVLGTLNPAGKPSMRQDLEAGRASEVELFSGTVLALGEKHGMATPVNRMLYDRIREIESRF